MGRRRIFTILGTRPELIRLSAVIRKLDIAFDHTLVHTGQNYDPNLMDVFYSDLNIRPPDFYLNAGETSLSTMETVSRILVGVDELLIKHPPDALLILGDTNSALAVIAAKRRKVPIFHMEAGNRCFDERVPEELNRKVVDHLSDINLVYSDAARSNLLREGLRSDRIIKTGSPMYEVLAGLRSKIDESTVLDRLKLNPREFFLVSLHREENVGNSRSISKFLEILNFLSQKYGKRIIVSTHPRTKKALSKNGGNVSTLVSFQEPFNLTDYIALQINARAVLSDSGTITEEASILNIRALNLRDSHERLEGMDEGAVMMVGLSLGAIKSGLEILTELPELDLPIRIHPDYKVENVSTKVVKIINSYIDTINRETWKKDPLE